MWRTAAMTWVDILLDRRSAANVVGLLAESQTFEIQPTAAGEKCGFSDAQRAQLHQLHSNILSYQPYLPEAGAVSSASEHASVSLDQALPQITQAMNQWITHIHPLTAHIKNLEAQLFEWKFLGQCLEHIPDPSLSLASFSNSIQHKPFIGIGPVDELSLLQTSEAVLLQCYPLPTKKPASNGADAVFVGIMPAQNSAALERNLRAAGARFAKIPDELAGSPQQGMQWLQRHSKTQQSTLDGLQNQLVQYAETDQIAHWNEQLQRWLWLSEVMEHAQCDEYFVQLCGWVPERKLETLDSALHDSKHPYLLRSSGIEKHGEPPVLLENSPWIKPFESFVRGFGVPRNNEIDPTPLLALTTPLMFGFMFGDVGQGAILILLGYLLKDRLPILCLFIPAGIASIFFGFMHGTIFCNEALIEPLWLHPLHHPLTIMTVALLFGAAMLLASLVLAGIQAYWERRSTDWIASQLPLVGLAVALPAAFWNGLLSGSMLVSALLISLIVNYRHKGPAGAVLALLKLLEDGMQLAINMLSFIRLGAFTLAHGGLSTAVMVLTAIPDNIVLQFLIFVLGNILIIALEGLVVSIQTTRLIMFEFFRRFMQGSGRPFKPLSKPAINPS